MNTPSLGASTDTSYQVYRRILAAITAALVLSVTLNIVLAHKIRRLTSARSARIEDQLKVGTVVPPIAARSLNGPGEVISYQSANQQVVLYVFTPSCVWCARNMDNFKTLFDKENKEYHFIGLSLSDKGLAEYVATNGFKLPVYSHLSPDTLKAYKLGSTPQTIVISPKGKVLEDWVGAYVGDQKTQVEAFFHVSLPGLRPAPPSEPTGGE